MGGKYASQYCKNLVGRFFCMETFPPCYSSSQYAVYPCRKTCDVLESYCHQYTPVDCPRDGHYMNATEVGTGTHYNSNNELQSCFQLDQIVMSYPNRILFIIP